jgi:hypothetical protein
MESKRPDAATEVASGLLRREANALLEQLTHENFDPHLNTVFQVRIAEDQAVPLELIEVRRMATQPAVAQRVVRTYSFALLFLGPSEPPLPQQMYTFAHPAMGLIGDLFIVPVGREERGLRYEAIFN